MRYIVLRNDSRLLYSLSEPMDIVAIVPEPALIKALSVLGSATELLDLLPEEFDELGAYLADVLVLKADIWLDSKDPALDLMTAITSVEPTGWLVLDEQEYSVVWNKQRSRYPFHEMELRAAFYGSLEYPLALYVESHTGTQYWFNDDVVARLLKMLSSSAEPISQQSGPEIPADVLEYPVELRKLSDGYIACVPYLGRWTFQADGDSPQDALENLQEVYREVAALIVSNGGRLDQPPPEPTE